MARGRLGISDTVARGRDRYSLGVPDIYGNYWLSIDRTEGPAILKSSIGWQNPRAGTQYMLLVSVAKGFLRKEDRLLRYFSSAEVALEVLNGLQ